MKIVQWPKPFLFLFKESSIAISGVLTAMLIVCFVGSLMLDYNFTRFAIALAVGFIPASVAAAYAVGRYHYVMSIVEIAKEETRRALERNETLDTEDAQ